MSEWKPIETHPTHGRAFLAWVPSDLCQYTVCDHGGRLYIFGGGDYELGGKPTLWRPHPASPVAEAEAEKERGLSLSMQHDPLAISALLDDGIRERDVYQRVVAEICRVLGDDGLHAQLRDLPSVVARRLAAPPQERV